MKTVPERLKELSALYSARNDIYKDNYKRFGSILQQMFPDGLHLRAAEDFNRFALLIHIMNKITRYVHSINAIHHPDHLDDLAVYAMMLQEYDEETKA